jgi:hypothetical protein
LTIPAESCPGEVTVIWVLVTVSIPAGYVPKSTLDAPANPLPLIVTVVPPLILPLVGVRPVTTGPTAYVNWSAGTIALTPDGVVTRTLTIPAESCPGEVTVIWVLVTVSIPAGYVPKSTLDAPANPLPLIVTVVPPLILPLVGVRPVIVGTCVAVTLIYPVLILVLLPPTLIAFRETVKFPGYK